MSGLVGLWQRAELRVDSRAANGSMCDLRKLRLVRPAIALIKYTVVQTEYSKLALFELSTKSVMYDRNEYKIGHRSH